MTKHANAYPLRILDVLETDGGWLTSDGIAHQLTAKRESVDRALWRLRAEGLVEHRVVYLSDILSDRPYRAGARTRGVKGPLDRRSEWRFL